MSVLNVALKRFPGGDDLPLPCYATDGSAGLDIYAALTAPCILEPGKRITVPCGFGLALPPCYEAQIRPRSGLAQRHGITVLNSPATIDSDYRGEICVLFVNLGEAPYTFSRGDRIAQMVIAHVPKVLFTETNFFEHTTERGTSGFGSTGGFSA